MEPVEVIHDDHVERMCNTRQCSLCVYPLMALHKTSLSANEASNFLCQLSHER